MIRWSALVAATIAVVLGLRAGLAQDAKPKIVVERDLVYGKGGAEDMRLDLTRPQGKGPFPAIVCIHGGGWRAGNRQQLGKLTELFAGRGLVAVTVSYRLTPKAIFPAQIEDCKAAVRWLRANAEKYHVDPERIGAIGFSAGGHLACLLGTADQGAGLEGKGGNAKHSSAVQAVVSFFGPTDFASKTWDKKVEEAFLIPLLGGTYEEKKDLYRKCSPLVHAGKNACPHLFFHGDEDKLVAIDNSTKMVKRLEEVGVYAKLVTMEKEAHGWSGDKLTKTLDQSIAFFQDKLKK